MNLVTFRKPGNRLRIVALIVSYLTLAGCWHAEKDLIGTQGIDPFGVGANVALVDADGVPQILLRSAQDVSFRSAVGTARFAWLRSYAGADFNGAPPLIASLETSEGNVLFVWGTVKNGVFSFCGGGDDPDAELSSMLQARAVLSEAMARGCAGDQSRLTVRVATASEIAGTNSRLAEIDREAAAAKVPTTPRPREREQKPSQVKALSEPSEQEMHQALDAFLRSRAALVELTDFRKEGCQYLGGTSFRCAYSNSIGADCQVNPIACLIGQTGIRDSGEGIFVWSGQHWHFQSEQ